MKCTVAHFEWRKTHINGLVEPTDMTIDSLWVALEFTKNQPDK